jgi:hypothetical protein
MRASLRASPEVARSSSVDRTKVAPTYAGRSRGAAFQPDNVHQRVDEPLMALRTFERHFSAAKTQEEKHLSVHRQREAAATTNADQLSGVWNRPAGLSSRPTDGTNLSIGSRALLGDRLGPSLDRVRIHDDDGSHRLAAMIGARALTHGSDVYVGSGESSDSKHYRGLLAHELTHVAQQEAFGAAMVQPKLKLTGKTAEVERAIALLNGGLQSYRVSVSKGEVKITQNFVELPPNAQQQALADRLTTIINDSKDTVISISSGSATLVGSYALGDIDIADVEMVGVSGLIHEIEEQYQKQVKGAAYGSETSGAHGEGIVAESEVAGAKRGAQHVISVTPNADGTVDLVVEIPYTYPGGKVVTKVLTVKKNNVVSFTDKP